MAEDRTGTQFVVKVAGNKVKEQVQFYPLFFKKPKTGEDGIRQQSDKRKGGRDDE